VEKTDVGSLLRSHRKDVTCSYILPISLRRPSIGDTSGARRTGTGR